MLVLNEIEKAIKRELRIKGVVSGILMGIGTVIIASLPKDAGVRMVGMLLAGVGLALMFHVFRNIDPRRSGIFLTLKNQPKTIVWIFTVRTQHMPFGFLLNEQVTFFFRTISKKEYSVKIPEVMVDHVLNNLKRNFPFTRFGYSKDLDEQYQKDPRSLLESSRD